MDENSLKEMRILIYTNILTPYRMHFFDAMYNECSSQASMFKVLVMSDSEPGRHWNYNDLKTNYTNILPVKSLSKGEMHIHLNFGIDKYMESYRPNVVICAGGYLCPGVWRILQLKRKYGYKTLFWSESHDNELRNYSSLKIRIREIIRKNVYSRFDGFWYAGDLSEKMIRKYASPNAQYFFMPNLVDEKLFEKKKSNLKIDAIKKEFYDENKRVFFCAARLIPLKGFIEFFGLVAKSKAKEKCMFIIAGDGELHDRIKEFANMHGIDVRLVGYKTLNEVNDLMDISDIYFLPSLSDANPLSCVEALWKGMPLLISTHCGNYPEVVCQGHNGYAFNYENEESALIMINNMPCN